MKLPLLLSSMLWITAWTCAAQSSSERADGGGAAATLIRLEEHEFGRLDDGTVVKQFTMRNAKGMTAKIITYGAIVSELQAPDRDGSLLHLTNPGIGFFLREIMYFHSKSTNPFLNSITPKKLFNGLLIKLNKLIPKRLGMKIQTLNLIQTLILIRWLSKVF
jgi:hypothetical protein